MADEWDKFPLADAPVKAKAEAKPQGNGDAWDRFPLAETDQPKEPTGKLASFARGAADGVTFGFGDELGLLDKQAQSKSKADNPWTHTAGQAAGTLLSFAMPGVGLAGRGAQAAKVAKAGFDAERTAAMAGESAAGIKAAVKAAEHAAEQSAKLGQAGKQMGLAVGGGALSGAGHAEEGERTQGALTGAAMGAFAPVAGAYGAGAAGGALAGALGPAAPYVLGTAGLGAFVPGVASAIKNGAVNVVGSPVVQGATRFTGQMMPAIREE